MGIEKAQSVVPPSGCHPRSYRRGLQEKDRKRYKKREEERKDEKMGFNVRCEMHGNDR